MIMQLKMFFTVPDGCDQDNDNAAEAVADFACKAEARCI